MMRITADSVVRTEEDEENERWDARIAATESIDLTGIGSEPGTQQTRKARAKTTTTVNDRRGCTTIDTEMGAAEITGVQCPASSNGEWADNSEDEDIIVTD